MVEWTFFLHSLSVLLLRLFLLRTSAAAEGPAFTFMNNCRWTVWPGILSGAGRDQLSTTGFELPSGSLRSIEAPAGWSGRLWARTGCVFDASGGGSCATADCGTGEVECRGKGAAPPATLAEFTLGGGAGEKDFYDVSLVDGYNLPMVVQGGGGKCATTGCAEDVNARCPAELRVGEGDAAACRSACDAFGRPEFCCSGEFASPAACRPTAYSELFKTACPKSYSYAFDDATSIFTCAGAGEFTVIFCPDATISSSKSPANPRTSPTTTGDVTVESDAWLASLVADSGSERNSALPSMLPSMAFHFFVLLHFVA
ncbi:hypothetical protein KSP39_PZI009910 [Platanthera zijinensis]|uniref:Thaumatin-like protein 1 n=1 Tax=Platanthera zijinensis TaxID=2320716 RepID=A0AAP0BJY8_9ASPA